MSVAAVSNPPLRMLWLELTRSCNEHCGHCYNDSGPHRASEKTLAIDDWLRILREGRESGASEVQFIGGEPTLVPYLPELVREAHRLGFELIEIYTNGTKLSADLVELFREHGVQVAVSLYSATAELHDRITGLEGSHARTLEGMHRLRLAGIPTRVAVIRVPINKDECESTIDFVKRMGIENVGVDDVRAFGRAQALTGRPPAMHELCGHCWKGTLCIDPQGQTSPCIMSRHMQVGNAADGLSAIVDSLELASARRRIYEEVFVPRQIVQPADVVACQPNNPYPPPNCIPYSTQPNPCGPHTCGPGTGPCYPLGTAKPFAAEVANLPNNPNPTPNCMPYSTQTNPCGPHTCGPGTAPCYPLGTKRMESDLCLPGALPDGIVELLQLKQAPQKEKTV